MVATRKRQATTAVVKVVDTEGLKAQALAMAQGNGLEWTDTSIPYRWGYVETPAGVYALCDEGVGRVDPVTPETPLKIDVYGRRDADHKLVYISGSPFCTISLNEEELRALPVTGEENLREFISPNTRRLESNYNGWRKALS
jgi:hypothetical protein